MKIKSENYAIVHSVVKDYIEKESNDLDTPSFQLQEIVQSILNRLEIIEPSTIQALKIKRLNEQGIEDLKSKLNTILPDILYSVRSPWQKTVQTSSDTHKIVLELIRGHPLNIDQVKNKGQILKALVWKKNNELLEDSKGLLQTIFKELFNEVTQTTLSENASFHMDMLIGELLSIYPFLNPKDEESIKIPIRMAGQWHFIDYRTTRIELTPKWFGSPLVACGLKPKDSTFPPLLVFKATTYPTDEGFSLSLLTDLNPFASIGAYAFHIGKKKIATWLNTHVPVDGCQAIIYGKSLGGALAAKTAANFPKQVSKVMAYGAPGFSNDSLKKLKILNAETRPQINIFCQKHDIVPYVGRGAPGLVNYYEILGSTSRKGVFAHAGTYSTHQKSIIMKLHPSQVTQRWRRRALGVGRHIVGVSFPILLFMHILQTSLRQLVHCQGRICG